MRRWQLVEPSSHGLLVMLPAHSCLMVDELSLSERVRAPSRLRGKGPGAGRWSLLQLGLRATKSLRERVGTRGHGLQRRGRRLLALEGRAGSRGKGLLLRLA